tara:strand:- start:557 stop:970 length:414 start_codon:yes stop_codon:yes gene_type:complete
LKNYKSKLGLELIIPISIIFGYALFELITEKSWFGVFIIFLIILFILSTFLSINYKIEKENLNVKCIFLVNENIEIKTIWKIVETYNPLSSPAASIDRIEIFYNKFDSILISPKKKKKFIEDILKINPNIEVIYKTK